MTLYIKLFKWHPGSSYNFIVMINKKASPNSNKKLFNDIDMSLLFGIKCASGNQKQQNYFEKLKVQTESAFINKKFQIS